MGGGYPTKARKRVEASTESTTTAAAPSLVRGKDGSAFARCDECKKDVPVALISFHSCSLDAKIKMNLDAQVVEAPPEVKKATERKKPTSTEPKAKKARVGKKSKDNNPNKRKRPPTAFFIFMDDFRKEFKEANPDSKDVKVVTKEGGAKWRGMSDEEKKVYQDKAAELKAEYDKAVLADNSEDGDVDAEANAEADTAEDVDEEAGSEKEASEKEVEEVSDEE
ncbi:high mobility group B protein 7-like [Humulus lupulus]|uniref:high mobility group B protein 7-like n=1 Tax=Humulus lupulus TaxID=3486 RepID=UPI002B4141DE|nr:high mobility group B protein 7-like [Humulus lupulus]